MGITDGSQAETVAQLLNQELWNACNEQNAPIICVPGSALSTYVKTSSAGPSVMFMRVGEFSADNVTLYGFFPPDICIPKG